MSLCKHILRDVLNSNRLLIFSQFYCVLMVSLAFSWNSLHFC